MKKSKNKLALIIIPLILAACSDPAKDAKEKGFSSVDEMKAMQARGYESMHDYHNAVEFAPLKFYQKCLADDRNYNNDCKGRKVIWKGRIVDKGWGRVEVHESYKTDGKSYFNVDVAAIRDYISEKDVGKLVKFEGVVGRRGFSTPNVDDARIMELETDIQREDRKKAESKKEQEEALRKEKARHLGERNAKEEMALKAAKDINSDVGRGECWKAINAAREKSYISKGDWVLDNWGAAANICYVYAYGKMPEN